jgi:hypothetical protein
VCSSLGSGLGESEKWSTDWVIFGDEGGMNVGESQHEGIIILGSMHSSSGRMFFIV